MSEDIRATWLKLFHAVAWGCATSAQWESWTAIQVVYGRRAVVADYARQPTVIQQSREAPPLRTKLQAPKERACQLHEGALRIVNLSGATEGCQEKRLEERTGCRI